MTDETTDETADDRVAQLEAELAAANDRIAELESSPAGEGDSFLGVRTPGLDAFEENQFRGEVQAWERDTGLSYDELEVGPVDEAVQAKADAEPVGGA